jgi:outer membrane receptor protein involved in Fe transport
MRFALSKAALTIGVSALSFATAAAQESQPASQESTDTAASGTTVGDIIVTAQRRSQRLQDVPVAVSVVSGDALNNQNLKTLEDVGTRLPNVKITTGSLVNQINVRGVGSGQNAGFEQSVATFVDGVYRSRSLSSRAALFDIEQVEVLKGPQTTFFGANAIAGALNITTRKPKFEFGYDASALYAFEDGEYNVEAGVNVPLAPTFAIRAAGRLAGMDGYIDNNYLNEKGPHDRTQQARISAAWEPSAAFRSDLRFDYFRSRTKNIYSAVLETCPAPAPIVEGPDGSCAQYLASGGKPRRSLGYDSVSPDTFANVNFKEVAWTNSLDVGAGSITAITAYIDQTVNAKTQPIPLPLASAVGGAEGLPVWLGERYHQFSQELRYQSDTNGPIDYMFGGYYSGGRLENHNYVGFLFLPFGAFNPLGTTNAATPVTGRPNLTQEDRTLSAFASLTWRPIDHLRINLGARYSNIRKTAIRDVQFGASPGANPATWVPFDAATQNVYAAILGADLGQFTKPRRVDDKFMPSVGIQYDVAPDVMVYATYSKGFKAGGYSAASLANAFEPETVDAYEIGLKGQFLDRRLTFNTALFRSDYKNLQESTIVISTAGTIISLVQNAASSRSQGIEMSAQYRANDWLTLNADVAYLDAKYRSYPAGACTVLGNFQSTTCTQNLSGKRRPYAPEWSGNVGVTAAVPFGDYQLRIAPSLYFSSKFFESATADPLLQQDGFAKVDLQIAFGPQDERWQIALIGKNLTDKATAGFRQQITNSSGVYAFPDRPRSIAVQFRIKG